MNMNARLPEFQNNRFYAREFISVGILKVVITNEKDGKVLVAEHFPGTSGDQYKYHIIELNAKYQTILTKHSTVSKPLIDVESNVLYAGGIAFILNGMWTYFKRINAEIEVDILDLIAGHKEINVPRKLKYVTTYSTGKKQHKRGTVESCTAITPQAKLECIGDALKVMERRVKT